MIILRKQYIEQQREFGLKDYLQSKRGKLVEKLDESIKEDLNSIKNTRSSLLKSRRELPRGEETTGKEFENLRKSRKDIRFDVLSNGDSECITKHQHPEQIDSSAKSGILRIRYDASPGELYHELEHIKNSTGENGPLRKAISKSASGKETGKIVRTSNNLQNFGNKWRRQHLIETSIDPEEKEYLKEIDEQLNQCGVIRSLRNFKNGKIRELEEKAASKRAIQDLKNLKLDKGLVDKEKNFQDLANGMYKRETKMSYKIPIRNSLASKKNRGDFNL